MFFFTKLLSYSGDGLLSTGPTPSSFYLTLKLCPNIFKDMNDPTYSNCTQHDSFFQNQATMVFTCAPCKAIGKVPCQWPTLTKKLNHKAKCKSNQVIKNHGFIGPHKVAFYAYAFVHLSSCSLVLLISCPLVLLSSCSLVLLFFCSLALLLSCLLLSCSYALLPALLLSCSPALLLSYSPAL